MPRVLVTGVSGPIGTALLPYLEAHGAEIVRLVRGPAQGSQVSWDPLQPLAPRSVSGFDAVVHLAGASIVGRWTEARKKAIRESRVEGTRHLATALAGAPQPPRVFISGSAIGYYGNRGDEILDEESSIGTGFLAEVTREWEQASQIAASSEIRVVNIRIGLVLSRRGGALDKMLLPFKLGLGGKIGSGRQWWSWIHVEDLVAAIYHAFAAESLSGAVNLVAPSPLTNAEFTRTLASVLGRPALLPLPAFAARLALGEMADELLLSSTRVEPATLMKSGFSFRFSELRRGLEDLLA